MAVNFNDPTCGFSHREVVEFINKQIRKSGLKSHFYRVKACHSWNDMEKKLRDVVTDSEISEAAKEACAWRTLARAVTLAERQKREAKFKMKRLRELLHEQRLFSNVLVGTVKRLREVQAQERERAQGELQQLRARVQGVVEERNFLHSKLVAFLRAPAGITRGRESEEERRQAAGPMLCPSQGGGGYWATDGAQSRGMRMLGKDARTSGLALAAPEAREGRMVAQGAASGRVGNLSYPQVVKRDQESPLHAFNLTAPNYSSVSSFPPSGCAEVPPRRSTGTGWSELQTAMEPFTQGAVTESSGPPSAKRVIKRKAGDWDCKTCFSMNFSWRKICYFCGKARGATGDEKASALV
ncbi:testis-expressed protein 13A [Sorex araneus]|uniref:testis-expressed protein 13A n=1 Tax=Sorex araneus TaxID=42254 RepID=UPI002433D858|nr:testis-expressed protein 13A [Sorex araneus]